jgi:hypothetical protein
MTAALAPARLAPVPAPTVSPRPVRLRPAPPREPPFDDELPPGGSALGAEATRLPFAEPRAKLPIRPPRPGELPDPAAWGRRLLVGITETIAGRRPILQLAALLTPSVAEGIAGCVDRRGGLGNGHWLAGARVRSVRATQPSADVAELSATVQCGSRVRAVALRLEVRHGRWRCTRLEMG